jgi:hypothetical protein
MIVIGSKVWVNVREDMKGRSGVCGYIIDLKNYWGD